MNVKYVALTLLLSGAVSAEELKIAVVDTTRLMQDSLEGQAKVKEIEAFQKSETKKIEAAANKIETKQKEVQAKLSTMSDAAIKKAQLDLETGKGEFQVLLKTAENTLNNKREEVIGALAPKAESALNAIAEAKNLDIVFDKLTGHPVYVSGKAEITKEAIADMNKKYTATQSKVGGAGIDKVKAATAKAAPAE